MSSMGKMLKQAKKMEQQMAKIQSDLAEKTVEKTSGGGAVKAVASCDGVLKSIKISPEAVDPEDVELLEDMILTAVSGAIKEAKEISDTEMARVTQGLSLPGMM
ncbi:MAG: YbaB/EbfC family nucleoid-associated protein [Verrucomicrobiia bacterium]